MKSKRTALIAVTIIILAAAWPVAAFSWNAAACYTVDSYVQPLKFVYQLLLLCWFI